MPCLYVLLHQANGLPSEDNHGALAPDRWNHVLISAIILHQLRINLRPYLSTQIVQGKLGLDLLAGVLRILPAPAPSSLVKAKPRRDY
jgi:hypothetical protein